MGRPLFLHEYVDISGLGSMAYMAHTVEFQADAATARGLELLGTFSVVGSTGRWPQVVNLWECVDGWDGWRRLMEATNLARTENSTLQRWWSEALKVRSGGFDRLLGGVAGCPTVADLRRDGVTGSVIVHEISECRPGAGPDYLAAVRERWAPVAAEYGHTAAGLYEVLLTDTEVVTLWATDPDGHVALGRASDPGPDHDARISAWRAEARGFLTRWHEELLVPYPGTLLSRGDPL